jgi:hypothetical protein
MTKFCGACGAPLNGTEAFCGKCGASTGQAAATPQQPAEIPTQPAQPVQFTPVSATQVQAAPKSSPVLKIVLALVVLLALGGLLLLGGVFYAAHRASQKIHELAGEASSSSGGPFSANTLGDDPCRFLTKEEVSQATGVTIIRTKSRGIGCAYIAEGDPVEMTSKHMSMMQGTGGLTAGQSASSGTTQDVEVLSYVVMTGALQKALSGKIFDNLGSASQSLSGVGDQAVVVGGGMMMVRKGDKTIQIVYMRCPCTTDAVKPLAQKLVSAM